MCGIAGIVSLNGIGIYQSLHHVSCASVIPLKRVHLMIEILKHINMPVKWTHIGDGVLFEELKAKTKTLANHIVCDLKGMFIMQRFLIFIKKHL